MKIKDTQKFRSWIRSQDKGMHEDAYWDENFMGCKRGDLNGFFSIYHGKKNDPYAFLKKEFEMAQDGQAIYEFVQNAADSGSTHFYMFYDEEYFLAINNGKVFSKEGISSILNIGQSHGKTDPDKIGQYGIGFKLVHRLVGKTQGLDEIFNKDKKGYRGPVLFSWSSKQQFIDFLEADPSSYNKAKIDDQDAPWLLKILLTNFPAFPGETVKDLEFQNAKPYMIDEVKDFQEFLNRKNIHMDLDVMNQGSIFFIKLGDNKHKVLKKDRDNYVNGLSTSMHFLKSIQLINLNGFEIGKDTDATNRVSFNISKDSPEHADVGLTEERDKESNIIFEVHYASNTKSAKSLTKHPNIYKYFPAVKEINNLALIIHSNVFSLSSNRQTLDSDSAINDKLLKLLVNLIAKQMDEWKVSSPDEYRNLFESILWSRKPPTSNLQIENFYHNLIKYAKSNVPTSEKNYLYATDVVIKNTDLNINPVDLGISKQWFFLSSEDHSELANIAAGRLSIEKWTINELIKYGKAPKINSWIATLDSDDYILFLQELDSAISLNKIPDDVEFIRSNRHHHYSLNDLKSKENEHFVIIFTKINGILDILQSLSLAHSIFDIEKYNNLKEHIQCSVKYLSETTEHSFIDKIKNRFKLITLCPLDKQRLFLCMKSLYGVDVNKLSKIKLFCNADGIQIPINRLINSKIENIPAWLHSYKILDAENIFPEIGKKGYLCNDSNIYNNIVRKYWENIIGSGDIEHENISEFYEQVKGYYDLSEDPASTLDNTSYIYNGNKFLTKDAFFFDTSMENYPKYSVLAIAVKVLTDLHCPDKNILQFLTKAPFQTNTMRITDLLSDCSFSVDGAIELLNYCTSSEIEIFNYGYFVENSGSILFTVTSLHRQYFSTNEALISFIEEALPDSFKLLPRELSTFKNMVLSESDVQKLIPKKLGGLLDAHIEPLMQVLNADGKRSVIESVETIEFKQRDTYTEEDFEYSVISVLKKDQIESIRDKIIIVSDHGIFPLTDVSSSTTDITFDDGKYTIPLTDVLPNTERFENAQTISQIKESLVQTSFFNDKLNQLFDPGIDSNRQNYQGIYDELIQSTKNVLKNGSQLAFVVLYNEYIEKVNTSEIMALYKNSETHPINYPLYLESFPFIPQESTLHEDYMGVEKLLKLGTINPEFNVKYSSCRILKSPYFDEQNFDLICPEINFDAGEPQKISFLDFLYNYWKVSNDHQRIVNNISWNAISGRNTNTIIGFCFSDLLWLNEFALESEQCPDWLKKWGGQSPDHIGLLQALGVSTEDTEITMLRKAIFSDGDYDKDSIPNNKALTQSLLENTIKLIVERKLTFSREPGKFRLIEAIVFQLQSKLVDALDSVKLKEYACSFNDHMDIEYYNVWSSKTGYSIYFYDGEMPYTTNYNGYTLRATTHDNIGEVGNDIYLNKHFFNSPVDLIDIETIPSFDRLDLVRNLFKASGNNSSLARDDVIQENKRLKRELENLQSISVTIGRETDELNPPGSGLSSTDQKIRSSENKLLAKKYLYEAGYDLSEWNDDYAIASGILTPSDVLTKFLVKGVKGGYLFISPVELLSLINQDSELLIVAKNDRIERVPTESLIQSNYSLDLRFEAHHFNCDKIVKMAEQLEYDKGRKFIIGATQLSSVEAAEYIDLSQRQQGIISPGTDEDF